MYVRGHITSSALGLHLRGWEFRLCIQYWLGLQMVEDGTRCPIYQVDTDPFGDHQVGCGGNGDRIHRHDSLRDILFSAAQSAALAPKREVPSRDPWGVSKPLKQSRVLVAYRDRGWASPQPTPLPTCFNGSLSVCGEGMLQCRSAASLSGPQWSMGLCNLYLFVCLFVLFCFTVRTFCLFKFHVYSAYWNSYINI